METVRQTLSFSIIKILGKDRATCSEEEEEESPARSTITSSCSGPEEGVPSDCPSCEDLELDCREESDVDMGAREEDGSEEELYVGSEKPHMKRPGRMRFTPVQIQVLEKRFQKQHYLLPADRKFLAKSLQMTERQVKTWFQNKRAQYKRTRPLVRNPVYHHPSSPPGNHLALSVPRLHLLRAGPFGINIHLPATSAGVSLGCHSTLLPPPPLTTFSTFPPPLPPHLPMPMAYIPVPITPPK